MHIGVVVLGHARIIHEKPADAPVVSSLEPPVASNVGPLVVSNIEPMTLRAFSQKFNRRNVALLSLVAAIILVMPYFVQFASALGYTLTINSWIEDATTSTLIRNITTQSWTDTLGGITQKSSDIAISGDKDTIQLASNAGSTALTTYSQLNGISTKTNLTVGGVGTGGSAFMSFSNAASDPVSKLIGIRPASGADTFALRSSVTYSSSGDPYIAWSTGAQNSIAVAFIGDTTDTSTCGSIFNSTDFPAPWKCQIAISTTSMVKNVRILSSRNPTTGANTLFLVFTDGTTVKYITKTAEGAAWSSATTIVGTADNDTLDATTDDAGNLFVSFVSTTGVAYVHVKPASASGGSFNPGTANARGGTAIRVSGSGSTRTVRVAYQSTSTSIHGGKVVYGECVVTVSTTPSCAGGNWGITAVENADGTNRGSIRMVLDATNNPIVSYFRGVSDANYVQRSGGVWGTVRTFGNETFKGSTNGSLVRSGSSFFLYSFAATSPPVLQKCTLNLSGTGSCAPVPSAISDTSALEVGAAVSSTGNVLVSYGFNVSNRGLYIDMSQSRQSSAVLSGSLEVPSKTITDMGVTGLSISSATLALTPGGATVCNIKINGGAGNCNATTLANTSANTVYYTISLSNTSAKPYETGVVYDLSYSYTGYKTSGTVYTPFYNTQDASALISKIRWGGTPGAQNSDFQVFIRTGPSITQTSAETQYNSDTPPAGWTAWCGEDDGISGTCSSTAGISSSDFVSDFKALDGIVSDGVNDQYFQLKLVFASGGVQTPIIDDIFVDYVKNAKPTVTGLGASVKTVTAGAATPADINTVTLTYTSADADSTNTTLDTYVFYDLGVTVTGTLTNSSSSSFEISDPTKIPDKSLMLIDDEFVYKSGNTYTRAVNRTRLAEHIAGPSKKVWIMASPAALSGSGYGTITLAQKPSLAADANYRVYLGSGAVSKGANTIKWDLKSEPNLANQSRNIDVRIVVNDRELANAVSALTSTSVFVDTTSPASGAVGYPTAATVITSKVASGPITLAASGFSGATEMAIKNDHTGNTYGAWTTYSTSIPSATLNCSAAYDNGDNLFTIKVRDAAGNETTATSNHIRCDSTPPSAPTTLQVQNVCDPVTTTTRPFLTWIAITDPGDFAKYNIKRNGTTIASVTDIGTVNAPPSYSDTGFASGTATYTVTAVDTIGNESPTSNEVAFIVREVCETNNPPVLTNGSITYVTKTTATASWTTNVPANTLVGLSVGNTSYDEVTKLNNIPVTTHSIGIDGLKCGTDYNVQFTSTSNGGTASIATKKASGDDSSLAFSTSACAAGPIISDVVVSALSNSVTISWKTNIDASAELDINGHTFGSTGFDTTPREHNVSTNDILSPSSSYVATIRSANTDGAPTEQSNIPVNTTALPTSPPVISSVQVSASVAGRATVTWTTDVPATSYVQYGLTNNNLSLSEGSAVPTLTHSVLLTGLRCQENYFYRVISGNGTDSTYPSDGSTLSFTSAVCPPQSPPSITNIAIVNITESGATVTWNTDQDASAVVQYSLGDKSYDLTAGSETQFDPVVSGTAPHAVQLSGLQPGKIYYLRVKSGNISNLSTTNDNNGVGYTFTTKAGDAAPALSGFSVTNISQDGATVSWTTDIASDSFVDLGFNAGVYTAGSQGDAGVSNTNHSVTLQNLTAETTYYYQARSTAGGIEGVSYAGDPSKQATLTFTTLATPILTPEITGVTAVSITSSSAVIQFTTSNVSSVGTAEVGLTKNYSDQVNFDTLSKIHTILIENLDPETLYYYKVSAESDAGKIAIDDNNGAGYTFTTTAESTTGDCAGGACPPTPPPGFCTEDTTAPSLTSAYPDGASTKPTLVSNLGSQAATISWTTDEPSANIVEYGTDPNKLEFLGGDVSSYGNEHTVDLKPLRYEKTYYYQIVMLDGCGNQDRSDMYQFTTKTLAPGEELDILQKTIDETASAEQLSLLESLGALSSTTQSIIKGFLDALGGVNVDQREEAVRIVVGTVLGPPRILGAKPNVTVSDTSAVIEWETLAETTGIVKYATDANYKPESKENPYNMTAGDSDTFVTAHRVALLELKPFTTYHYQISGAEKNTRKSISIDRTFKTSPLTPKFESIKILSATEQGVSVTWKTNMPTTGTLSLRNLKTGEGKTQEDDTLTTSHDQIILGLAERSDYRAIVTARSENGIQVDSEPIRFTTRPDNEPPVIDQVRTKLTLSAGQSDTVQAVISWQTNEPSVGTILYDEGVQGDSLRMKSESETEMTLSHVIVISKLRPGTIYTFKVRAKDLPGNEGLSREYKMYTPLKSKSVLELIIKNFEDAFGFLQ